MDTLQHSSHTMDGVFEALLQNASDATVIIDETQTVIFWNRAAEQLWGYSAKEAIGQSLQNYLPNIAIHPERNGNNNPEQTIESKKGTQLAVSLSTSKIQKGSKSFTMILVKDVSEQNALLKDLTALQNTVNQSFARIEFDTKGYILNLNQNFLDTMSYDSTSQLVGKHHAIFVEESYKESMAYAKFWEDLGRGQIQGGEFKRVDSKGKTVWLQATYTPVRDNKGNIEKIIKLATNITRQKEIAMNAQALQETVDASFARIEFDPTGNILDLNDNFANTLGYTRTSSLVGRHHQIFVEKEYRESYEYKQFWKDLEAGIKQEGEFKRVSQTGQEIWILAAYTPVTDNEGKVIKVIKIASDITKQKQVVQEVNRVVKLAGEEGKLDARLKMEGATGDWEALINSVNMLLKSVSDPVIEISEIIKKMAEGNLATRFDISNAEGDIKTLGESLNTAIDSLNTILTNTSQIADLLAASSEEMLTKGEEMQNTTKEVASATQQMAEGAQQQAQQTDSASKQMEELLQAANEMQSKAELINQAAKEGKISSAEGLAKMKLMLENMGSIQESAQSTAQSINVLTERSEEIASTLSVITDIASQTNLLALNAAIEAARAGDAGRGFAVVAEEIRKLAEGSRKSAGNIEKIIREVQKDITVATKAIDFMEASVKNGSTASQEAEEVFRKIESSSEQTFNLSEAIVSSTNEQKEGIDSTVQNIEQIVVVSEETASGTEQIASSSKVLSQGMNEVSATSKDLADVALQLQENLSRFILK